MKKYIPYIIIAALIVALLFSVQKCSKEQKLHNSNLEALTDTVKYYKNRLGSVTATKNVLTIDNSQLKDIILKKDKELSELTKEFARVKSIVKYETITKYDTVLVAFDAPVPVDFTRTGKYNNKWLQFNYNIDQAGFSLEEIIIPNEATVITGIKRKWFLGKETITTDITNSNPHISVSQMQSIEVTVPEPIYKKWYIWFLAGLTGGLLLK